MPSDKGLCGSQAFLIRYDRQGGIRRLVGALQITIEFARMKTFTLIR